ncbi:tagaturonate reductase [Sporomusa termitida]|uniref:Altronate oxidoreductase n=1 Tax=Sporomusa termitida TaxID=2377 RepID=A0A517DY81_9FIRM|nr:tagaturonate reductase [Sporomusa termitida]QDR82315.1 Altronate oxidoreductase [Sporomusa termitida]
MNQLNAATLANLQPPADLEVFAASHLPERVIQFGEGNFLRAFVDWMIHRLNKQGLFNGRIVVVQPIADGLAGSINEQDGLYTLLLRGLQAGRIVEQKELISSVSRGINPYTDWAACLACAENPAIEFVVSNTTEAGIIYDPADRPDKLPPVSFPGKLTVYLYHRFQHFQGEAAKGMVILPCELIERNGEQLQAIVLRLAREWGLPAAFAAWVSEHNTFVNTLVDRVVTGYPREEAGELEQYLGYQDRLLTTGELFHLWVIEGPAALAERLPFAKTGLNVIWTNDMSPYRTRKVRILNGAHTASVPVAYLYGLEAVKEMMDHPVMGKFIRQVIWEEIVPSINLDREMLSDFAGSVIERFENPFIKHYLLSILLNSSAKFKTRNLPSLLAYYQQNGVLSEKLVFSLAALITVYKDGVIDGSAMKAQRAAGEFIMKDDLPTLEFCAAAWRDYDGSAQSAAKVAQAILGNTGIWGTDLTAVPGLTPMIAAYLYDICEHGIQATVAQLVE